MPAEGKVNIMWQIIFVLFIPVVGIWAFYRIKKLRKAVVYIMLPAIGLMMLIMVPIIFVAMDAQDDPAKLDEISEQMESSILVTFVSSIGSIAIAIWEIYLTYKWSEEWNRQFDIAK